MAAKKKSKQNKDIVLRGQAFWFNELFTTNKFSGDYQLILGNLDKDNIKKAEDAGLYVRPETEKYKDRGRWLKFKSKFPLKAVIDRNRKPLTEFQIEELRVGNGSEVAVKGGLWYYEPNENMEGATGVGVNPLKVQLINVIEIDSDDEEFFDDYGEEHEDNEGEEVPDSDDPFEDDDLNDEVPF